MVSYVHEWPDLEASTWTPVLPTLTPTKTILSHLRTLLYGATQNGEHLTTLVARPSMIPETPPSSPLPADHYLPPQPTSLVIDGFAHTLSHNTVPIPAYAQLTNAKPIVKYLPPGDTALTAFPIAAVCRIQDAEVEIVFSVRVPIIKYHAFNEQMLNQTNMKLSQNSLSILLRTELSNKHGLLEQRSTTTMAVQPIRLRDTTSISKIAGSWYTGDSTEYMAAFAALGRHIGRRRNRRIGLTSPSPPLVAKAIILRFASSVWIRWVYISVLSGTTTWLAVSNGSQSAGVPITFEAQPTVVPVRWSSARKSGRKSQQGRPPRGGNIQRQSNSVAAAQRTTNRRASAEGDTITRVQLTTRRSASQDSLPMEEESGLLTARMRRLRYEDPEAEGAATTPQKPRVSNTVRISDWDISDHETDTSIPNNFTSNNLSNHFDIVEVNKSSNECESMIAELCRKYLNIDYNEEVARQSGMDV